MTDPTVILDAFAPGRFGSSYRFSGLKETIRALTPAEVLPALERIEAAVAGGLHAAGYLAYEAATGLNPCLATFSRSRTPLLWFGIFRERHQVPVTLPPPAPAHSYRVDRWRSSRSTEEYTDAVRRIRDYIAAGDTYQVNHTFRRRFRFSGDPLALYHDLCRSQQAPFCAYLAFDRTRILSASPELFFSLDGDRLLVSPMKGTAGRGRWPAEDRDRIEALRQSPKDRAENLMIVDLLRNDLGMVAQTGSVHVDSLFDVSPLPTLLQMTSTVSARLRPGIGFTSLLQALFPCGSITGAPKRRTMELIRELEREPRGIYTGCIGYLSPGPEALFSVAIRTLVLDLEAGRGELGVGSGVTYDSTSVAEHAECLAKGRFATLRLPEFQLVETLLLDEDWFLPERHLARLAASAVYFGFAFPESHIRQRLEENRIGLFGRHKVRLLLSRDGSVTVEASPLPPPDESVGTIRISRRRIDQDDPFLFHKTTHRPLYRAELARNPGCTDVIFCNTRGEVCEGANHNIVARIDGRLFTPPVASGLLAGTFRDELLEQGILEERVLTPADLHQADDLFLINSVRRWRRVRLARPRTTSQRS